MFQKILLLSTLIHAGIIFFPPEITLNIEFTKTEQESLEKIEELSKELQKPTLTKEIYEDYLKNKRQHLQEMDEKYTKYTEEDKNVVKKSLKNATNIIKKQAKKRAIEKSRFQKFISKKENKAKETVSQKMKVSLQKNSTSPKRNKKVSQKKDKKCDKQNSYFGIGVAFQSSTKETMSDRLDRGFWEITSLAEGYVGEKNDIKVGDHLLGAYDENNKFHEGVAFIKDNTQFLEKKMRILLNRNGKTLEKWIALERICFSIN